MNNFIPISYDNPERPTVSGRELHEFLQVGADHRHWFPRMCEYGFTEGEDFNPVKIDRVQNEGGRKVTRTVDDHQLTIPMAKELCMIQRNERGKQARQYFLTVEAQWNSPEAVMRRAVLIADRKVKELQSVNRSLLAENNDLKPDAEYARAVCIGDNCRTATSIAKDYGMSSEKLKFSGRTATASGCYTQSIAAKVTPRTARASLSSTTAARFRHPTLPSGRKQASALSMSNSRPLA